MLTKPRVRLLPKESRILAVIIFCGVAARAFSIWFGRPEFVGWFNHSYYYWVQVKGVLVNGQLPYADLPLIFFLYGAVANLVRLFGLEMAPAIVNTTRAVMSVAPALIALPVYGLVRRISGSGPLAFRQWVLVALSAFLPLTLAYMPELLQKNTLGLLFLGGLMYATYELLRTRSMKSLMASLALFLLIAVTHIGTLAVTLLFGLALFLAVLCTNARSQQVLVVLLVVLACSGVGLIAVYLLDPGAFNRVLLYLQSSLPDSLVGGLFSSQPTSRKFLYLLGILIPLGVLLYLVKDCRDRRASLQPGDHVFWLGNVLFVYLLILPVLDLELVPRFILFAPLPVLVVSSYVLRYHDTAWLKNLLVALASLGVAVMLLGEVMSLIRLSSYNEAIHSELLDLKDRYQLRENDFVLTRYGVNPICNWFLGTKSGLITAFNRNDVQSYDRLFVLNPRDGRPAPTRAHDEDADRLTRRNVPLPADTQPLMETELLAFYELRTIPDAWLFDREGNWIGLEHPAAP